MKTLHPVLPTANSPTAPTEAIGSGSSVRQFRAGEIIYFEGDEAPRCYQVASGFVKEYSMLESGKRQVLDFFGTGELFGITQDDIHPYTAEAITDCAIRCFQRESWLKAVTASPALSEKFMTTLLTRLHRSRERLTMLGRMSATARMAAFLKRLAEDQGTSEDIRFPMSRQDIGDHLGLTIETVCRVFTDLKRRRIIASSTARLFSIADVEALDTLSRGDGVA